MSTLTIPAPRPLTFAERYAANFARRSRGEYTPEERAAFTFGTFQINYDGSISPWSCPEPREWESDDAFDGDDVWSDYDPRDREPGMESAR